MKAYVVLQKGFEYNDEVYSSQDPGCGFPTKIFFTEEAAKEKLKVLEIREFKNSNITDYAYEIEDVVKDPDSLKLLVEKLNQKYGEIESKDRWNRPDEYRLHPEATIEESTQYINLISLSFFEIVETEVDQQDLQESKLKQIL